MKTTLKVLFYFVLVMMFGSVFGLIAVTIDGKPFYVGFFGSIIVAAVVTVAYGIIAAVIIGLFKAYEWIDDL